MFCLVGHDNRSLGGETRVAVAGTLVAQPGLEFSAYLSMASHLYMVSAGSTDS